MYKLYFYLFLIKKIVYILYIYLIFVCQGLNQEEIIDLEEYTNNEKCSYKAHTYKNIFCYT